MSRKIIIEGITESGEEFRPSNWAEMMSGQLSTFQKHHIRYSPMLQPSIKNGHRCIVLDVGLKISNPKLYESIVQFAINNHLKMWNDEEDST